jgi:hypothetical protein
MNTQLAVTCLETELSREEKAVATYFVHALLLLCEMSHTSTRPTFSELKASKRRQNSSKISTVMDILQRAALPSQHYPPPKDIDTHLRRVLPGRVVILCFFWF